MAYAKAPKASLGQKVVFVLAMVFTFPFSLVYLLFWRGRCVYCGKRILFNRHVCKKCQRNATGIVDDFDGKMQTFFAQMGSVEELDDILGQYQYILDRIDGIEVIYDALDDQADTERMRQTVFEYLKMNLETWYNNHEVQFIKNEAYKHEVETTINESFIEFEQMKDILTPYLTKLEALSTEA
ncbi:hypothetical protein [Beduini massiliensis]|uniref:hypothetical protein n=1 Tax=Beduini massiliensis TaxID=1585974 RepID=UPI00059A81CB|nr:hypothetical protein [Beduini massiliensis]